MDKKQINIPKYIWVIAAILVVCIIFLIFVQVPFSQQYPTYEKNHNSAVAEISTYNDYLARADAVQASINAMKAQYEEESDKLFVNAKKTAQDIRDMLKKLDYDLSTLSVAEGVVDSQGRTSSTGTPLYTTTINFNFTASYQKMLDTFEYFETESDGSYYISQVVISGVDDEEQSNMSTEKKDYEVSLVMNLYYFNPDAEVSQVSTEESSE